MNSKLQHLQPFERIWVNVYGICCCSIVTTHCQTHKSSMPQPFWGSIVPSRAWPTSSKISVLTLVILKLCLLFRYMIITFFCQPMLMIFLIPIGSAKTKRLGYCCSWWPVIRLLQLQVWDLWARGCVCLSPAPRWSPHKKMNGRPQSGSSGWSRKRHTLQGKDCCLSCPLEERA